MARTARKALSVLLSICLACLMTPFTAFGAEDQSAGTQAIESQETGEQGADAQDGIKYQVATLKDAEHPEEGLEWKDAYCTEYLSITQAETTLDQTNLASDCWYVVDRDFTVGCLGVGSNVHLILLDGCTLTCTAPILKYNNTSVSIGDGCSLTIYGQENNTGTLIAPGDEDQAGIKVEGELNIHGGSIEATGGQYAAGIGNGYEASSSGTINIYGGTVTAEGGGDGAGIGNGRGVTADEIINIYGGNITATGGSCAAGIGSGGRPHSGSGYESMDSSGISIYGGTINATGGYAAAGIGGGYCSSLTKLTISGGTVYAQGGTSAAGIGGGECDKVSGTYYGSKASGIVITGGSVTAIGGDSGAGIGGGLRGHLTSLTISGGNITATGGSAAAGIGGGENADAEGGHAYNITISGGTVHATGGEEYNDGEYGTAGIGGGAGGSLHGLTVTGGDVTAIGGAGTGRGCGIGGRYGDDIVISGGTVLASASSHSGSAAIGCDYGYNRYSITITGGYVHATCAYNGAAIGCGSWAPDNTDSYVKITGGTVVAETNTEGASSSQCTALGVGLRNGGYQNAGTLTIDPKLTIYNTTTSSHTVVKNNGGDMVSAMTGIESVLTKEEEITSLGVTTLYGERTLLQSEDEVDWGEAEGVVVVPTDEMAKLEVQREYAKMMLDLTDEEYQDIIDDANAYIAMGVTAYVAQITDAKVSIDGNGQEYSLHVDMSATLVRDGAVVESASHTVTQEEFAAMKGGLRVTLPVPAGSTPIEIIHTSDDGTVVFDDFAEGSSATFAYDKEAGTVTVDIEHCSHLIVMTKAATAPTAGGSTPATGDAAPVAAVALAALLAGACVAFARRKVLHEGRRPGRKD